MAEIHTWLTPEEFRPVPMRNQVYLSIDKARDRRVIGLEKADLRQQLRLNKADINSSDTFGRSLVHWAVITGNSNAVETLLDHGASANSPDREQMTPLHDIFLAPSSSQLQCAQLLLNAGAEINALDTWGRTPFRIAVGYATINQDLLLMLINEGADINQRDIYSQSPLLKSIQGSNDTTQLLLNHSADTEARDAYGNTPILEAIYRSQPKKLQMLLRHGAKTNEYFELKPGRRARGGPTHVLDFVVWYGSVEIMQVIEESANSDFYLSHPVDAFGLYRDFRLANERKAGSEESEAFVRILSRAEHSYEVVRVHSDISAAESEEDDSSSGDEVYEDAHDYIDG
ncbi:hypothetical protein VE00_10294 [Pseudogymnoascus sp. WSF 3629]|nr:hypothetical protein VE00_10294 [Pseudogymnoascus sp. WSF 3629]